MPSDTARFVISFDKANFGVHVIKRLSAALFAILLPATFALAAPVETVTLENFEGAAPTVANISATNSSGGADSYSSFAVTSESGSKRLQMQDTGGLRNGIVMTLPGAITQAGYFLVTADIKVANSVAGPIRTFGMAAKIGSPTTAKVLDGNAGYVLNLDSYPTNAATLGYQTIGAAIQVPTGLSFPQNLTLYFSTDPSGSPADAHGGFTGSHRGTASSWPMATNSSSVYIDNIKRIGPGNFGEERHCWISVSDGMTNLSSLDSRINQAFANGFNCIDILVRYRANHYYTPNRDFSTWPNNEPYVGGTSASNDPIQRAIDRGHQLGMRVYGSFSTFLTTDSSNTWPSAVPTSTRTYVYNGVNTYPKLQTTADEGEGLWMDAGLAASHTYITNIVMDLVQNYDLDGLIFDRMRYAGSSFGYNPQALQEMGYDPNNPPAPSNAAFIAARQTRVALFLENIYKSITDLKPWMIVGTVPIAYSAGLNDTYKSVMQSWPKWSAAPGHNRVISFGAEDLIQPQFYRQWDSGGTNAAPGANRTLMTKALYGDTAVDSMDYGLMPGAITNVAPLFYAETIDNTTDAINTANTLAANICDTQTGSYYMNGNGIYSARGIFDLPTGQSQTVIQRLRAAATTCGTDVMSPSAPLSDFLMKAGWDNTPPYGAASPAVTAVGYFANLTWIAPPLAPDGDGASRYLIYASTSASVPQYYENQVAPSSTITGTGYMAGPFPTSGNYYFRIVSVDDYNNKGASVVIGPVALSSATVNVESRQPNGNITPTPTYTESTAMLPTSSKSTADGLQASGARYSTNVNMIATYRPNLPISGKYNIYVTMGSGTNNNSDAKFTITGTGTPVTGNVALRSSNTALVNQWYLLASDVNFSAGTAGTIAFQNLNGNASTGARFVMDAVKFELVKSDVADWQLY